MRLFKKLLILSSFVAPLVSCNESSIFISKGTPLGYAIGLECPRKLSDNTDSFSALYYLGLKPTFGKKSILSKAEEISLDVYLDGLLYRTFDVSVNDLNNESNYLNSKSNYVDLSKKSFKLFYEIVFDSSIIQTSGVFISFFLTATYVDDEMQETLFHAIVPVLSLTYDEGSTYSLTSYFVDYANIERS